MAERKSESLDSSSLTNVSSSAASSSQESLSAPSLSPATPSPAGVHEASDYIPRAAEAELRELASEFPVVSVTGPRQSGKSVLVWHVFPDYAYVSLEDDDEYALAHADPRAFLTSFGPRLIIDEAQRAPEIFNYLQGIVDATDQPGGYILTGSQNFLLLKTISQSLAGRVGLLHLLPLSLEELTAAGRAPSMADEWVLQGGYPRLFRHQIRRDSFYRGYIDTYLERDVRAELGVRKVRDFLRFVELCATRIGQPLNLANLARDAQISSTTARDWLSILEASFIVYELPPYFRNLGKQLTKSSKLYFYDTGLACELLGIRTIPDLVLSPLRGNLFEDAVITEVMKQGEARGVSPRLSFWRDRQGQEIDLLVEQGIQVRDAVEIKSSTTFNTRFFDNLEAVAPLLSVPADHRFVVYGGSASMSTRQGRVVPYAALAHGVSSAE